MKKLSKIINTKTQEVVIANEGQSDVFVKEGFTFNEVERAYNGNWYITGFAPTVPAPSYTELRSAEYPPMADYLDAQVKLNSGDAELIAEGQTQLDAYIAACLAVKEKYPKA